MTMANWLSETSRPRRCAGEISEIYIGEMPEARPIAYPPSILHATKALKFAASPVPSDETAKTSAASVNSRFLPKRLLKPPEETAPTRQPISAQLMAQPSMEGESR